MPSYKLLKIVLITLLGLPVLFSSQAWGRIDGLEIQIIDDYGRPFAQYPLYRHSAPGIQRAYLEAVKGEPYAIRVRNRSDRRIGLVIAVDGRNIISGDKSYLGPNERMYILNPYQQSVYKGWRTGKNRVNNFYFTDAADSYADAWGDHSAMGVIAVAAFKEIRQHSHGPKEFYGNKRSQSTEQRSQRAPRAESQPGTGFGDEEYSPSRRVSFTPEKHPMVKHFIKYEWHNTLCRKGIISCYDRPHKQPNNRFWNEQNDYAPYPPGQRNYRQ